MVGEHNVRSSFRVTVAAIACLLAVTCGPSSGVGPATPSATITPHFTSSPPPVRADGFARFRGTVTDAATGGPLEGVCVVIATEGSCQPASPRTDSAGSWWIDLPAGVQWDFAWTKDGYRAEKKRLTSRPGEEVIDIALAAGP